MAEAEFDRLFRETGDLLGDEMVPLQMFWTRALHDRARDRFDMAYVYGQTEDNAPFILDAVPRIVPGRANCVCIPEQHGRGWPPHADVWGRELINRLVGEDRIIPIDADPTVVRPNNTMSEAQMLVPFCTARGWKRIGVIAMPFHLPRALLTTVSEIVRTKSDLAVYGIASFSGDWDREAPHSQGAILGTRNELVIPEMWRIAKYQIRGDTGNLIPPSEALAYLRARDRSE